MEDQACTKCLSISTDIYLSHICYKTSNNLHAVTMYKHNIWHFKTKILNKVVMKYEVQIMKNIKPNFQQKTETTTRHEKSRCLSLKSDRIS